MDVCDDDATAGLAPLIKEPRQFGADAIRQVVEQPGAIDDVVALEIGRHLNGLTQELLHRFEYVRNLRRFGAIGCNRFDLLFVRSQSFGIEIEQIE